MFFWLIFKIKVFIIKVEVKENSSASYLQRGELLHNVEKSENLSLNPMKYVENFS